MHAIRVRFREAASEIGEGAGRKFPAEMKQLGGEYARSRRSEGASWSAIADELGVIVPTVRRWAERGETPTSTFVPVRVDRVTKATYSAVLPGGLRIEAMELEAVVALVRALS